MKKNGLFTMVAILMAAMLATGCSKSESENMGGNGSSQKYLTEQEIQDLILPLLVGSWVHDGDCVSEVKSIGTDGITAVDSEYSFSESEKDTLKFYQDKKVQASYPKGVLDYAYTERFGLKGDGAIGFFGGVLVVDGNGGLSYPYEMSIYSETFPIMENIYNTVLFDAQRQRLYLCIKSSHSKIQRYRRLS